MAFISTIFDKNTYNLMTPKNTSHTIGIDVGIRNLAFCIIESTKKSSKSPITIVDWQNISLLPEINPELCSAVTAKSHKCKNVAKWEINAADTESTNTDTIKVCGRHRSGKSGKLLNMLPKINIKSIGIHRIVQFMASKLDNFPELLSNTTTVYIETQPTKNPQMKFMSAAIATYFLIRASDRNVEIRVHNSSSKHKLRVYKGPPVNITQKNGYKRRKATAILHTEKLLENVNDSEKWMDFFRTQKKKDDLADAFLHAHH